MEQFFQTHVCRKVPLPAALAAAYGRPGIVWAGLEVIADEHAVVPLAGPLSTPCLALRGEFDFVTSIQSWREDGYFMHCQTMTLDSCSHHGLFENPTLYGKMLQAFWKKHDVDLCSEDSNGGMQ